MNAVARRPARALAQNCEQLDRLATDMAHCLEDALRMRCASDVEQYEAASLLKRHVVCGDLDAADRLDEDGRRDARADLDRRRREAQESCLGAIQRCEGRFWRAAATGLFFVDVIKLAMRWKWLYVEAWRRVEASSRGRTTTRPMTWTWTATGRRSASRSRPNI